MASKFSIVMIRSKALAASEPEGALLAKYVARVQRYVPVSTEVFASETRFTAWHIRQTAKAGALLVIMDSGGNQMTSSEFARLIRTQQDSARRHIIFAVGPADGWSGDTLARADMTIAFGRITLPHELALVILAEQVYRALTILAGHPYHTGH